MSISISCPTCGKAYYLNESLVGKKVRCKHCADTFPVELDAVLPTADSPPAGATVTEPGAEFNRWPADEVLDVEREEKQKPEQAEPKPAPKAKRKPDQPEPAPKGGFPWVWCVLGGGALLILLLCGGIGLGIYLIIYNVTQAVNNVTASINNMNPAFEPRTVPEALADLQSGDMWRQQRAAEWLARTPSNPADQPQVSQALEPLLTDINPFVKSAAADALITWGGPNNVPALVKCMEMNDPQTCDSAMKALVKIRDKRGVVPIARQLSDGWRRPNAANALQSLGASLCEGEVVKYAFDPDVGTRTEAQRLLKGYGTKDSVILPQAIADLKAGDINRRSAAAAWLGQTPVVEARRAEVSAALDPVLTSPDQQARLNAVKAARVWGTKDNVPALVRFVDDKFVDLRPPDETYQAIELLISFKDERAYWSIAHYCGHPFEHARGRAYLQQIGAPAEPEVVKKLTDPSNYVRQAAWKALAIVGTKANMDAYQKAAKAESDGFGQILAQQAMNEIAAR
jgi:predicted Zn finger-like uncharacterized protein